MIVYNQNEILKKFKKIYDSGAVFRAFMSDEELFPYCVKLKTLKQKDIVEYFSQISKEIEILKKLKLDIEYKEFRFKNIGLQKLPITLTCRSREEFLNFIDKKDEFENFKTRYFKATKEFPRLKKLFLEKPKLLLEIDLDKVLQTVTFLHNNPKPNIYAREFPMVGIDTKFIEKNKKTIDMFLVATLDIDLYNNIDKLFYNGFERKYGLKYKLPLVRFRILDKDLYINGLSDLTINIEEFKNLSLTCRRVYIVENEITALSFPDIKDAIVIFGGGYSVGILEEVEWLKDKEIYYWGDIDMDGFAILSQARGYFLQIKSLFMDTQTIEEFGTLHVKSQNKQYKKLYNLTKEEMLVYERLFSDYYGENFRLEQERLPVLSRILVE